MSVFSVLKEIHLAILHFIFLLLYVYCRLVLTFFIIVCFTLFHFMRIMHFMLQLLRKKLFN